MKKNYEQYAITGMKFEYWPTNDVGLPGTFTVKNIYFFEDLDSYNISTYTE